MLVDNPVSFLSPPSSMTNNSDNDFSEFLNTELFASSSTLPPAAVSNASSTSPGSPGRSSSSRASSPSSLLTTPPQQPLLNTFPEIQDDPYGFGSFGSSASSSLFNFLGDEWKIDPGMGLDVLGGGLGMGLGGGGSGSGSGSGMGLSFGSGAYSATAFAPMSSGESDFLRAVAGAPNPSTVLSSTPATFNPEQMAIDPQLVGTPSDSTLQDEQSIPQRSVAPESTESVETDTEGATKKRATKKGFTTSQDSSTTLTITPVKVGGHGKSRKGTVQSGGVTKKQASPASATLSASVPITSTSSLLTAPAGAAVTTSTTKNKENVSSSKKAASKTESIADDDDKDDDDDLPADWRPPPEVFQKMTSKEKRQLRNKISARNFRVRRKEYINTLELDIAERDRLLQAIRSELGSTQSENLALRQEIATLKKALLEGRQPAIPSHSPTSTSSLLSPTSMVKGAGEGMNVNLNTVNAQALSIEDVPILNLPPPAPLPERSAAEELAARAAAKDTASAASVASSSLVTPNTHKDVSTAGQAAFWGGMSPVMGGVGFSGFGFGGGITPVHTVLMPELSSIGNMIGSGRRTEEELSVSKWVRDVVAANEAALAERQAAEATSDVRKRRLQENMNPTLNSDEDVEMERSNAAVGEFDNFVEGNAFTMKSMDAYRMQLWTRMAAQQNSNRHHHHEVVAPKPTSPASSVSSIPSPTSTNPKDKYHPDRISSPSPFVTSTPPQYPSPYLTSPHLPYANLGPKGNVLPSPTFNSNLRMGGMAGGLASQLKPHYFVSSNKPNLPSAPSSPRALSTLLAGKHTFSTTSGSGTGASKKQTPEQVRAQQQQMMYAAALATTASQTLLGKLGSAFWDAFSGGSSTSPTSAGAGKTHAFTGGAGSGRTWDADKVRKVLEGKAVVRVVDLDDIPTPVKKEQSSPVLAPSIARKAQEDAKKEDTCLTSMLEEKMKTLSLGKKH